MNKITLGIVAALFSASASADYKFIDLHSSESYPFSEAYAINDLNQAVGQEWVRADRGAWQTATLWNVESGTKTYFIDTKHGLTTIAQDINNKGDIVIYADEQLNQNTLGYLYRDGSLQHLSLPPGMLKSINNLDLNESGNFIGSTAKLTTTMWSNADNPVVFNVDANAINDNNQMVGKTGNGLDTRAALFYGDHVVDIGKGYNWIQYAEAEDINNNGLVVVNAFSIFGGYKPFVWENGESRPLQGGKSLVNAVNDHGIIVGDQYVGVGFGEPDILGSRAVIWDGYHQFNLNDFIDQEAKDAGWVLVSAKDINNNGWVVGTAYNTITFDRHAYALSTDEMLSPIPEPSTYLMLLAGLGLLGFVGKRRVQVC